MKVYKKVGRRYQEMGVEFEGFPCSGFWMVQDGSQNCILRLGDIDKVSVHALPYLQLVPKFFKDVDPTSTPCSLIELLRKFALYCAEHVDVATLK